MKIFKEKYSGKFKSTVTAILATSALLFMVGCGESDEAQAEQNATGGNDTEENAAVEEEAQEISVAVVQDYPPFEYMEDGELTGFDVDIIEAIAAEENLIVNWEIMRFDAIIPALQADQMDAAVSAIAIREDRAEVVDFSNPYFESGLSLVVPTDSHINSLEDLEGATIVAKQGTSSLELANELAEEYNGDVRIFQEDAIMYMEITSGNADAVINDYPSAAYKIATDGEDSDIRIVGDRMTGEDYGIVVSKGADGLVEIMNSGLSKLFETGKYDDIYDQYFGE
ncbi:MULTISPECIES: transporter substrate-binding domain-containing protein [Bacillaceae]|uniref:Transporter substrate-binding domain-containing protein n=1 Tax=Evansella alkalicola TaxID=745819 RepID=A0ABS6JSC3_9BACI|nr:MULTISPECIES: transporter substrate-binding domain-containing protein [Bacillaceae]MBU9721468.1 transporter substrate-binding domain-containing protein [Bacillus alkalicola]